MSGLVAILGSDPGLVIDREGKLTRAVSEIHYLQTLHDFVKSEVADGSTVKTDVPSYNNLEGTEHDKQVVGEQLAHKVLPWVHRIFANKTPVEFDDYAAPQHWRIFFMLSIARKSAHFVN